MLDQNPGTDPHPRRIELDRNIGTDPFEIPERILGDDYQNPITEDTKETEQFGVNMPHVQSRIHSDYDSAESIANSDILKMENYEKCWPHRCMHMGEEKIMGSLHRPKDSGEPEAKKNTEERGKCKSYSS